MTHSGGPFWLFGAASAYATLRLPLCQKAKTEPTLTLQSPTKPNLTSTQKCIPCARKKLLTMCPNAHKNPMYRGYHSADAPFNPRLPLFEPSGFRKRSKSNDKPLPLLFAENPTASLRLRAC